jgi:hypothetical protein
VRCSRESRPTYHNRSLSLYAKLGFDVREPISTMLRSAYEGVTLGDCNVCSAEPGQMAHENREGEELRVCRAVAGQASGMCEASAERKRGGRRPTPGVSGRGYTRVESSKWFAGRSPCKNNTSAKEQRMCG